MIKWPRAVPWRLLKSIAARTASKFGVQFWSSEGDLTPRKKEIFPRWLLVHCNSSIRFVVQPRCQKGSAQRSLSLIHKYTDPCLPRWFDRDIHLVLPCQFGVEPTRLLLSTISDHTAVGCVLLEVLCVFINKMKWYFISFCDPLYGNTTVILHNTTHNRGLSVVPLIPYRTGIAKYPYRCAMNHVSLASCVFTSRRAWLHLYAPVCATSTILIV